MVETRATHLLQSEWSDSIPIGADAPGEVESMLEARIQTAESNGMSRIAAEELRTLVFQYTDIFGLKLGPQPVSAFPTLVIQMPPGVKPVRARARPMPAAKRTFMRAEAAALTKFNMIYPNPSSSWPHPVLVVPKPKPAQLRMTVDLRQGNALQKPSAYPMPHLESQLNHLSGMHCFGALDLLQGYWQLACHKDSQECQAFVTPDGTWTPRRVLHGSSSAVAHLQSCMDSKLLPLDNRVMAWLDDLLASAATESALLDVYRKLFALCRDNRLILHAAKVDFFCSDVRWCGRLISSAGVKCDPRHLQGLLDMNAPTTGAEPEQFCCAMGWIRASIPECTTLTQPLLDALEAVYAAADGKRAKRAVARAPLKWSAELDAAFAQCKAALAHAIWYGAKGSLLQVNPLHSRSPPAHAELGVGIKCTTALRHFRDRFGGKVSAAALAAKPRELR